MLAIFNDKFRSHIHLGPIFDLDGDTLDFVKNSGGNSRPLLFLGYSKTMQLRVPDVAMQWVEGAVVIRYTGQYPQGGELEVCRIHAPNRQMISVLHHIIIDRTPKIVSGYRLPPNRSQQFRHAPCLPPKLVNGV